MDNKQDVLKAYLKIILIDKDGKKTVKYDGKSHTWVENYYVLVFSQASGCPCAETTYGTEWYQIDGTKTENSTYIMRGYGSTKGLWYDTTQAGYGPVCGTGTGAEVKTDYALGTLIAHGVGDGQMSYGDWTRAYTLNGTIRECTIERTSTNNSGASITVNETGLYALLYPANNQGMLNRDKLDTGIAVADGQSILVQYKITLDFGF